MNVIALLGELAGLIRPGIELTNDLVALFRRGQEIANAPPPEGAEELAEFKRLLDEQKARLDANTAEIEKD